MFFLWELLQQQKINSAETAAQLASSKADALFFNKEEIRKDLEKLTLATQAIWELLRDHLGLSDDQLRAKIQEIDGRDGMLDGKISSQFVICPQCNRRTATAKNMCFYCGYSLPSPHVMK